MTYNSPAHPPFMTDPLLNDAPIHHGFFGSQGGVSSGLYDSLNCGFGSDDTPSDIQANRDKVAAAMGLAREQLAGVYQHHSADVITITDPTQISERPKADGLVTALDHVGLGILTADCAPLLFCDRDAHIIGACHAGWRGAASGIIQNTITAMTAIGAQRDAILCVVGPTIAPASYQVGQDMRDAVLAFNKQADRYFTADPAGQNPTGHNNKKYLFDLPSFAADCARDAGVRKVAVTGHDTYGESHRFFSHRRATHHALPDTGRQISVITQYPKSCNEKS
ncbi:MAG: peptidoglycan editing factor PgeF [Candidatus Puniceispirillaceae bacterium]